MRPGVRRRSTFGLLVYVAVAAVVVLTPDRSQMLQLLRALQGLALDLRLGWTVAGRIEPVLNVLLVVPIPVLGAVALQRWSFTLWVLCLGVLTSTVVETLQWAVLPGRTPSLADVVANSTGALLGWLIACWARRRDQARGRPLPLPQGARPAKGAKSV